MLADVEHLKSRIRATGAAGTSAMTADDVGELERLLAAASSRLIEARPERTLEAFEDLELTFALCPPQRVVQVPDLRTVTAMTIDGAAIDPSEYLLMRRPRELCALWVRFTTPRLYGRELAIAGAWGPAGAKAGDEPLRVRDDVADAALVWAARAWHNRAARFSDTVQSPDGGVASYFRNLPPDVKLVVDGLEVPGL